MSSPHTGSRGARRVSVSRLLATVPVAALLCLSCTMLHPRLHGGGQHTGTRAQFNQSCGAACAAPVNASTGEILAPAVSRAGQVFEKAVQAAEVLQGFIHVTRFLDEAQKGVVEGVLKECVQAANKQVDEELFGKDRTLPDSECEKEPPVKDKLAPSWARHLGKLKHAVAFECIQRRLAEKFPDNFAVEPRYRKDELMNEVLLTDRRTGSLRPDIVIHFTRNATRIQCIYDLKFPCGYEVGNPWNAEAVRQMKSYESLGGQCKPALVTPQFGVDRR